MKNRFLPIIALSLVLLCGCSGYREIERGYLVTTIAFKPDGNGICIIAEAISSSDTLDKPSEKITFSSKGDDILDAYRTLESEVVKPLYFEQVGTLVVESTFDRKSLAEIIDFCGNLQSASLGIYVVQSDDVTLLYSLETDDGVLGYDIIGIIKNYEKSQGGRIQNQLYQLKRQQSSNKDFYLPSVNAVDGKLNFKPTR